MAKGKKTVIRSIKKISDDIVEINDKQYLVLDDISKIDILKATSMKITSNGNRIVRFDDTKKTIAIDVKRDIQVIKVIFTDMHRASRFKKVQDSSFISDEDKEELIANAPSFIKAREIVSKYRDKKSKLYDNNDGKNHFYITREIKN